jgi:protease-4
MPDPAPPPNPPPIAPPAARRAGRGCLLPLALVALFGSLLVNALLLVVLFGAFASPLDPDPPALDEKFLLGDRDAADKVAVVRIEGVITDGTALYPIRQMERAARDRRVKAVVLRVDSPGGMVTASDELYRCLVNLRDDTGRRFPGSGPKPLAVSMGGLAASGGYYVAMAGNPVAAERTTITGSIGVFAALPNVAKLANDNGVTVELVKAGGIKAGGSFFHALTPEERQTWQDTVDAAYDAFLGVVATGRPLTREQLRDEVVIDQMVPVRDAKGNPEVKDGKPATARYTRTRADGGTFTAEQALRFGLIDRVEDLPGTIRAAAAAAGLSRFRAVTYERPPGLWDLFLGDQIRADRDLPDLRSLSAALTPRLWYLGSAADGAILTTGP